MKAYWAAVFVHYKTKGYKRHSNMQHKKRGTQQTRNSTCLRQMGITPCRPALGKIFEGLQNKPFCKSIPFNQTGMQRTHSYVHYSDATLYIATVLFSKDLESEKAFVTIHIGPKQTLMQIKN